MTRADIEQEIRAILREATVSTVETPWNYTSDDFTPQIRSALRHLAAKGLSLVTVMADDDTLSTEPEDAEGVLIALFVAHRLISGDLTQKLMDGELGVIFKTGSDYMDTTTAARQFAAVSADLASRLEIALAMMLADQDTGVNNVFGLQSAPNDQGQ